MLRPGLSWLALALAPGLLSAAQDLTIDDFEYPDAAAAQAAYRPGGAYPPVSVEPRDGGMALRIECPFSQEMERVCYDRDVTLDLSHVGQFAIESRVDDPASVSNITLYFRSGPGWYGAAFNPERTWGKTVLTKADFQPEGQPTGWHAIDGYRLSPWRSGARDTFVLVDNLIAHSADVAVIWSTQGAEAVPSEAPGTRQFAAGMAEILRNAGVDVEVVTDEEIAAGALDGRKLVVFAYAPRLADPVAEAATRFVEAGGRIIVCYTLDDRLAGLLGIRAAGWVQAQQGAALDRIVFDAPDIGGLPASTGQSSWCATLAEPDRPDARAIGWWADTKDARSATAAVFLSDTGIFIGHVVTSVDPPNKQQMMAALVGHFLPEVWVSRAESAIGLAGKVGPFDSVQALQDAVRQETQGTAREARVAGLLDQGSGLLASARASLAGEEPVRAGSEAVEARASLERAYAAAQRTRAGEFRAFWDHDATGLSGEEGWEATIRRLKEAGFNAVVPNMWWGGIASYDSAYLPHSEAFEKYGDQVAQCVEAAHKYGIEVHPWKVNWNLANAPEPFYEELRAAGRTTKDVAGNDCRWLCPSHPDNFQLELNTMLEVARNYDVDGIHFDYIRYEGEDQCYCEGCRERFEAATGLKVENWPEDCHSGKLHDAYRQFRCDQITRLVRAVSEGARQIRPYVKISAAVFPNYPSTRDSIGQDWGLWVREGYLDFVCPMDYTGSRDAFEGMVTRQLAIVDGQVPLYPGIGASAPGLSPDQVIAQAAIARKLGTDGFIVFELGQGTAADLLPRMRDGMTSEDTYVPHNGPRFDFGLPPASESIGAAALANATQTIRVRLESYGNARTTPTGLRATLELRTTDDRVVARLGPLPGAVDEAVQVTIEPGDGRLVLVATGELLLEDGETAPFTARSVPLVFERP